jgi:16S rRNA (uracil1498-N3)-methyltransferase
MRVPRIYLDQILAPDQENTLDQRSAHYLATVLRMKAGMEIVAFDGSGLEYHGVLSELGKKSGRVTLGQGIDPGTESPLTTILGIGISRGERMDYVIQKSTELGVSSIQPLFTENCEVKLDAARAEKRRDHWRQVSISACEQSGRVVLPSVFAPMPLERWLETLTCQYRFMLDRDQEGSLAGSDNPDTVSLLIGPEGGLSDNEKALAVGKGFRGLNLGPRTLRTETAPVAVLSLCQFLWGN